MKPGLYQVKTNGGIPGNNKLNDGPMIIRMCFTQAMIDAANPEQQPGLCERLEVHRSGNKTHTEFGCTQDGTTSTGQSDETVNGNTRTFVIDVSTSNKDGTHAIHLDTEMTFLGSECNAAHAGPPAPISVRHYRYETLLKVAHPRHGRQAINLMSSSRNRSL